MSGAAAAKTLLQIEIATLKGKGETITPEKEKELFNSIKDRYDKQTSPYYAASRIWVDAIIDPIDTRKVISMGIEMADQSKITKRFNVGALQT
jgi:acetyl-CoA carboxylase carboxyltransferase component